MGDSGSSRIPYLHIFIYNSVLGNNYLTTELVLNVLISTFLFNKCIYKMLGYWRITVNNHNLHLGTPDFHFFSVYFRRHSGNESFLWHLFAVWYNIKYFVFVMLHCICYLANIAFSICLAVVFNFYSCLAFHCCGTLVPVRGELDESFIEVVHLLALIIYTPASELRVSR